MTLNLKQTTTPIQIAQESENDELHSDAVSDGLHKNNTTKISKGQRLYAEMLAEAKELISLASRDFQKAAVVKKVLREMKIQLIKGHTPELVPFEEDCSGKMYNEVSHSGNSSVLVGDRVRNPGRNVARRFKSIGEVCKKSGRR